MNQELKHLFRHVTVFSFIDNYLLMQLHKPRTKRCAMRNAPLPSALKIKYASLPTGAKSNQYGIYSMLGDIKEHSQGTWSKVWN